MKVLVCGSRDWLDIEPIRKELSALPKDSIIIHGAARGADTLADQVAVELGLKVKVFPASWHRYGRAAGPIRNQKMLEEHPDLVLAFCHDLTKSKGTADMIRRARLAKVKVKVVSR